MGPKQHGSIRSDVRIEVDTSEHGSSAKRDFGHSKRRVDSTRTDLRIDFDTQHAGSPTSKRRHVTSRTALDASTCTFDGSENDTVVSKRCGWRQCCLRLAQSCKRRAGATTEATKAAIAKEFNSGIGSTAIVKQLTLLRQKGCRAITEEAAERIKWASSKVSGPSHHRKDHDFKRSDRGSISTPGGFGLWSFIIHNPGDIRDFFTTPPNSGSGMVGCGGSAKVFKMIERQTGVVRAVKRMPKRDADDTARLYQEITIMKRLDHPNIVKLFETFEDSQAIYLVIEFCEGGDLLDRLLTVSTFTEYQASMCSGAVLMVLNYLAANDIVHRDIKPENILFKDKEPDVQVSNMRLVDFGSAALLEDMVDRDGKNPLHTPIGSVYYIAPEVLRGGPYTSKCDVWSVGVMAFMLLSGRPPFLGPTDAHTLRLISKGEWIFPKEKWEKMSKNAKHFIRALIEPEPQKRMGLTRALKHPWVREKLKERVRKLKVETVNVLMRYHYNHKVRKAALMAVAYQLEFHDILPYAELFHSMDLNGDGILATHEFTTALATCGVDTQMISDLIDSIDADGSGAINFSELVAAMIGVNVFAKNHAAMMRAFRCFDQDESGGLTVEEVAEVLDMNNGPMLEEVSRVFSMVDTSGSGLLDYKGFYHMLTADPGDDEMAHLDLLRSGGEDVAEEVGSSESHPSFPRQSFTSLNDGMEESDDDLDDT